MKRYGHLIEQIADTENLYQAYYKARLGKMHKTETILYANNLHNNIMALRSQFLSGNVEVGNYTYFKIYDPKERTICAAPFAQRVMHHAIINICHQYFDRNLISDTYATRIGKGIYAAIGKAKPAMAHYNYAAKLDVRKYFDSINHITLKNKLLQLFKDARLLNVFYQIIDSYQTAQNCGLPIGNLTSQYFANFYLSATDHYIKEQLKTPVYLRYMDDMLLFGNSREGLRQTVRSIEEKLDCKLQLQLKPWQVQTTKQGVSFLGYKLLPYNILLNRRSKLRFKQKMVEYSKNIKSGKWNDADYQQHIIPLLAFAEHADTQKLRKEILKICG